MRAVYFIQYYPWGDLQINQYSCETEFEDFKEWFSNAFNPKSLIFYDSTHDRFIFAYKLQYFCCLIADSFLDASEKFFKSYINMNLYGVIRLLD